MVGRGVKGDKGWRRRIREVKEAGRMWGREKKITWEWGEGGGVAGAERWNEGDNGARGAVMKRSAKPASRSPRRTVGPSRSGCACRASVITSCHAISCSRRQKYPLTHFFSPRTHRLCLFPPQTSSRPSSDSEPRREGESKVLSGSQPNINPVTSPRSWCALIF